jgi:thiol-disulfide isomerase/thioredoxin
MCDDEGGQEAWGSHDNFGDAGGIPHPPGDASGVPGEYFARFTAVVVILKLEAEECLSVKIGRLALWIVLVGLWVLLACKLPEQVASLVKKPGKNGTQTATATVTKALVKTATGMAASLAPVKTVTGLATPGGAYPGTGEPLNSPTPGVTLTITPVVTNTVTLTYTAEQPGVAGYPGPGQELPTSEQVTPSATGGLPTASATVALTITPTASLAFAISTTPTSEIVITPSATSMPTVTPTPTPSPTPTPTITPTPIPPPAWVVSELYASDPDTVKLAAGKVQLLMFFAFWDGVSQAMAPIVHGVEERFQGQVYFTYLDIDDPANNGFKKSLGYITQPHFFLLDGAGMTLRQWRGYVTAEELVEAIEAAK